MHELTWVALLRSLTPRLKHNTLLRDDFYLSPTVRRWEQPAWPLWEQVRVVRALGSSDCPVGSLIGSYPTHRRR